MTRSLFPKALFLIAPFLFLNIGCDSEEPPTAMQVNESEGQIDVLSSSGESILSFVTKAEVPSDSIPEYYTRNGFIHPLYSPNGVKLTADYPKGHIHQHGIFHAWTRALVEGDTVDFWNQQAELGTVRLKNLDVAEEGSQLSVLRANLEYIAKRRAGDLVVAEEDWTVKIFDTTDAFHLLDLELQHRPLIDSLTVLEYHYGGMGFRGNELWNLHPSETSPYDSLVFVQTNDMIGPLEANHSRPEWIAMWGIVGADTAGFAVFPHPNNLRHPQPVRVHPTMPYFSLSPMVLGPFTIYNGEEYRARFRIVTFDGTPDLEKIAELRKDYY